MTNKELAEKILERVGGKENVTRAQNCMTRLRIDVKDYSKIDVEGIKGLEGVISVVQDETLQVVLGPGKSRRVTDEFLELAQITESTDMEPGMDVSKDWKENKAINKAGQKQTGIKTLLRHIANIFTPLIPGFIVYGICVAIANLIAFGNVAPQAGDGFKYVAHQLFTALGQGFFTYLSIFVGVNAAKEFKVTPVLGGMIGGISGMANITNIAVEIGWGDGTLNAVLRAGKGGVLAVILGVFLLGYLERWIRKHLPDVMDTVFTPLLTILIGGVIYIFAIMPVMGLVSSAMVWVITTLCDSSIAAVRVVSGFLSAALFLPMVTFGLHHGLVGFYSELLTKYGFIQLYPALAMAGAGQVGAAIALWIKARKVKNTIIERNVEGAIVPGILGVGEHLIYGVTRPLGKPFITAGLGAGFGGAICMALRVASTAFGPSGLLAIPMMTYMGGEVNPMAALVYAGCWCVSLIGGFILTWIFIKEKDLVKNQ